MTRARVAAVALLLAALAVGAFLRFDALGEPCYWLDETLGETLTDAALVQPWHHWLTGLDREHGPLYYATQFASRAAGESERAGRLPAALFGLAAVFAIAFAGPRNELAALLLALSPLHVYYSREARPYALVMLLTAALLVAMLREARAWVIAVLLVALLYTSAAAAPVIAACAVVLLMNHRRSAGARGRRISGITVIAVVITLAVPLLYRGKPWTAATRAFPALDLDFARTLLHALTVSAFGSDLRGRTALVLLGLAIAGAFAMKRRDALVVVAMTLLPALFALAPLFASGHFFATRYVSPSLIGFVVLAAAGIAAIARRLKLEPLVGIAIVAAIATQTWDTARREPFRKLDWRAVAATLRAHVQPGDTIATAEAYSYLSLKRYLDVPRDVHFVLLDFVPADGDWPRDGHARFLVNAGYGTAVSAWMCRYPLLLASPLDGFTLHYAPSLRSFLATRSTPAEQRAAALSLGMRGVTLHMGDGDGVLLGDGWAGAEGTGGDAFRWAVGRRASVIVPRTAPRDRLLRFRAYPLTASTLPPQTVRVALNDAHIAELTLAPQWRDYAIPIAADRWREGTNTLTFDFARAASPASLDPQSADARELAVSFDTIAVDDADAPPSSGNPDLPILPALRLSTTRFLDARTAWRGTPTRFPAAELDRTKVETLLARLGFDPVIAWPQLARGEVHLEDVAETIAYGSGCEDDAAFLRRTFAVLLSRAPNAEERKALDNLTRIRLVGRLVKSDEFQKSMTINDLGKKERN